MTSRTTDAPRWLHVMYTDANGKFHSEHWACTFAQAEQRLAEIGATYWEIGAMTRPTDDRPWRLVSHATWQSTHSVLQNWRTGHRWKLWLHPCGHTVYRPVRYKPTTHGLQPGMGDALPAPRRVRCDQCAALPAQEA